MAQLERRFKRSSSASRSGYPPASLAETQPSLAVLFRLAEALEAEAVDLVAGHRGALPEGIETGASRRSMTWATLETEHTP
jgi:hypothetical protein